MIVILNQVHKKLGITGVRRTAALLCGQQTAGSLASVRMHHGCLPVDVIWTCPNGRKPWVKWLLHTDSASQYEHHPLSFPLFSPVCRSRYMNYGRTARTPAAPLRSKDTQTHTSLFCHLPSPYIDLQSFPGHLPLIKADTCSNFTLHHFCTIQLTTSWRPASSPHKYIKTRPAMHTQNHMLRAEVRV